MKVKFKKVMTMAQAPERASVGAAAFDLFAAEIRQTSQYTEIDSGIAMEIPQGHVGILVARSSVTKKDLMLKNSLGVIDSDYRGTIRGRFVLIPYRNAQAPDFNEDFDLEQYKVGDKCMQIMIMPIAQVEEFEEVSELSVTKRGFGGFGSTDVK